MFWKSLLLTTICLAVTMAVIGLNGPGPQEPGVMSPRLQLALAGEGPWVVWVFFRDKGLDAAELEAALNRAEAELNPRTARRRAKTFGPDGPLVDEADLAVHQDYLDLASATGARLRQVSRWLNAASFTVTGDQAAKLARLDCVARLDLVKHAQRSAIPTPVGEPVPVDPRSHKSAAVGTLDYGGNTDAMLQANVPPLHDAGLSGAGVLVGMLDTGFRTTHEALDHIPVLDTYDFIYDDPDVDDFPEGSRNHGTQTLSTLAGYMPGSLVAPAFGVSVVLAKTEDITQEVPLEEDFWVAGLEWMEALGADLISSSLSYFAWYDYEDLDGNTAVTTIAGDLAACRGLLVINSAGNSRNSTGAVGAPADGDSILAVGAVYLDGTVTNFSSPGPTADGRIKPDVAALGFANLTANPNDDHSYYTASGTSFSCPLTAGVAALMLERVPQLTPMQIVEAMRMTASQSANPDNDLGWGIIDAWAAATWFGPVIDHQPLAHTEDNTGPFAVSAVITDRVGVNPAGLWLIYRANGGGWEVVPLTATGQPDTYQAFIPGQPIHSVVEYYLSATGTNGFITSLPYRGEVAPFSFATGPWRQTDYQENPVAAVPDGDSGGITSVITVPVEDSGFIVDLTVDIAVTHPDRGELQVRLTGPDGTEITLQDHTGSGLENLTGNWPENLTVDGPGGLGDFLNTSNTGAWTLTVVDDVPGNGGTLVSWGLNFTLARYVTEVAAETVPRLARLDPNFPNPFNPRTEISFALTRSAQTRLSIFDVRGMLVRRLVNETLPAGAHTVAWDGKDRTGRAVGSGTYLYRLESGPEVLTRKMQLVR